MWNYFTNFDEEAKKMSREAKGIINAKVDGILINTVTQ